MSQQEVLDHYGQVIELMEDHRALVKIRQTSACETCGRCGGGMHLGDPDKRGEMVIEVNNPINAEVGQLVRLESRASEVLFAGFLLYVVPLLGLIAGLFLGRAVASPFLTPTNADLFGLILGLVFMALIYAFLRSKEYSFSRDERFKSDITAVVSEEEVPVVLPSDLIRP